MYEALCSRDTSFDGVFIVGVKTTKIFCRPTCPARKPKQQNVEFFADSQAAMLGGYRACRRCKPLERKSSPPAAVLQLMEEVEQSPSTRLREQDLRDRGFDPSTVRRQFQKHFGMTFHAFQRARHMGLALHEIRTGSAVVHSQQNAGYDSASGFWQSFRKVFGEPPSEAQRVQAVQAKWIDTPLGGMLALANDAGLQLLEFVDRRALETEITELRRKLNCVVVPGEHSYLDQIESELEQYFAGEQLHFKTPIVLRGTPFECDVWKRLQRIEVGTTCSYQQIAHGVDRPSAVRAVGRANGKNCLAIIVPCHRVIGADGKLTGYGGGLWRKQWLLDHEQEHSV